MKPTMLQLDIARLDQAELRVLEESSHPQRTVRGIRGIILSAFVVLVGVGLFAVYGAGVVFLAGLTVATVVVSATEKILYQRTMKSYGSLVQKLVLRVEQLEGMPLASTAPNDAKVPIS